MRTRHQAGLVQCSFYVQHPIVGSNKTMPPRRCKVHTDFHCPVCGHIACHEHRQDDGHGHVLCVNCYSKGHRQPGGTASSGKSARHKRTKTVTQVRKARVKQEQDLFYKGTQFQQYRMAHAKRVGTCPQCGKPQSFLVRKGVLRRKRCYGCYLKKPSKHRGFVRKHLRKAWRAIF